MHKQKSELLALCSITSIGASIIQQHETVLTCWLLWHSTKDSTLLYFVF